MKYVNEKFWSKFAAHIDGTVSAAPLTSTISSFCVVQKHNYKNYLKDTVDQTDYRRVTPVTILADFWQDVKDNVCGNFPKYVAEFLIEHNLRAIENSYKTCHLELSELLVERTNMTKERLDLTDKIDNIEEVLSAIKSLSNTL